MPPTIPEDVAGLLGEAVLGCLQTEFAPQDVAALARSLFPTAATLRVSLLTGDPSVLASLGSLLVRGPLRLGLLPTGASAAGASVVRQAPVYLTAETREAQGLVCYDFEGGSVFALPLLLAAALAPGAAAAAAPLLSHCNLLLGVQAAERLVEGQEEGEDTGSDVSVELTDSEEGEEGWEEGEGLAALGGGSDAGHEGAAGAAAEAEGENVPPLALSWAAGGCRSSTDEPHEDPGASSAAMLAAPLQESEGEPSGHSGSWQRAQQAKRTPLPPPESPAAAKARARVEATRLEAPTAASSTAAGPYLAGKSSGPQSSLGSLHTASSWGSEQLPPAKASPGSSEEGDSPQGAVRVPLERLAGATWHRLLRFADPRLEACFAARLAGERWKSDATSLGLCLALQLALLGSSKALGSPPTGWASHLALATTAAALALVLAAKPL
ncbi:hypothetical protein ABPG77_007193 [Micractinium sp. CCAP 211/92]